VTKPRTELAKEFPADEKKVYSKEEPEESEDGKPMSRRFA
jgi:hypothetical protein